MTMNVANKKIVLSFLALMIDCIFLIAQSLPEFVLTSAVGSDGSKTVFIDNARRGKGFVFDYDTPITLNPEESFSYMYISPQVKGERTINFKQFQTVLGVNDNQIQMSLATYDEKLKHKKESSLVTEAIQGSSTFAQRWSFVDDDRKLSEYPKASSKIALIIGNERYNHMEWLNTSRNSAYAVGDSLRSLGFRTLVVVDADYSTLESVLNYYYDVSVGCKLKILYYIGHGKSDINNDYIIPTDILENKLDSCFSITKIAQNMQRGTEDTKRLLFFDACRTVDPLHKSIKNKPGSGAVIFYSTDKDAISYPFAYETDSYTFFTQIFLNNIKTKVNLEEIYYKMLEDNKKLNNQTDKTEQQIRVEGNDETDWDEIYLYKKSKSFSTVYGGISAGSPDISTFIGWKICKGLTFEGGLSYRWKEKSKDVYLDDENGITQFGYNYCAGKLNLFTRLGWNFLVKKISVMPYIEADFLTFKGQSITSYSTRQDDILKAVIFSPNICISYSNNKKWQFRLSYGYECEKLTCGLTDLRESNKFRDLINTHRIQAGLIWYPFK